jgi:2-dehydro-3-deoxygluconokinase
MDAPIVTFGEMMGRIAPVGSERFTQALPGAVDITFGGGEANVAVSLAMFGAQAAFVTALPNNPIADACLMTLRALGVDTSQIVRTARGRLGLYYLETGANQRAGNVVYDREDSALMITPPEAYDWADIFSCAGWFHFTGITPALSEQTAHAVLAAVKAASEAEATISCDLNFRKKLWGWSPGVEPRALAEEVMRQILQYVDVIIANEEDAEQVLGIKAEHTDVNAGRLNVEAYCDVAAQIVEQFPNVEKVAITLRESLSASHNNWGGLLYDADSMLAYLAPLNTDGEYQPYEIRSIVDRVGGGDAFAAGLIYALTTDDLDDPATAIRFAVAASCLKHSMVGDLNYATRAEVDALMGGAMSGRVNR